MDSRKIVMKETATVAIGMVILTGVMVGVFAALGRFQLNVILAAFIGCAVSVGNHFFLAVAVSLAADRAERGEVNQAQKMIRTSASVRLLVMGVVLVVSIVLGANALALLLPLLFTRPVLMLAEFFRKKEDA